MYPNWRPLFFFSNWSPDTSWVLPLKVHKVWSRVTSGVGRNSKMSFKLRIYMDFMMRASANYIWNWEIWVPWSCLMRSRVEISMQIGILRCSIPKSWPFVNSCIILLMGPKLSTSFMIMLYTLIFQHSKKCSNEVEYFITNAEAINQCQWPSMCPNLPQQKM